MYFLYASALRLELGLPRNQFRDEILSTLMHEMAHYLGIDDDHLDEIGWG